MIPSWDKKDILGVLFESNIFSGRAPEELFLVRVMMGGSKNSEIAHRPNEELISMGIEEIKKKFAVRERPKYTFVQAWPMAIPQYDKKYPQILETIKNELNDLKGITIVSNFLNGVSLSDCVSNARKAVEEFDIQQPTFANTAV